MKCKSCGCDNPDPAKFCTNCGERLEAEITCPKCGCENKDGAKFCNECGCRLIQETDTPKEPMSENTEETNNKNSARKCPNCGFEVGESDTCESCGYDVTEEKYILSNFVDSESSEEVLLSIDKMDKKRTFKIVACIAVVAAIAVVLVVAILVSNSFSDTSTEDQPIRINVGDISLEKKSELLNKKVVVSGYVDQLGTPEYNEKYGYVTYYLTFSDKERVQVNYSGEDARTIAFNVLDILEVEGVVTDVYKVTETILQISCKKISNVGVATPPPNSILAAPSPTPTIDPVVAKRMAEEKAAAEAKSYETGITYEQLARTPNNYKGQKVKFSGEVVQVLEGTTETQLRLAVNGDYDCILFCRVPKAKTTNMRILEDDYITIMGVSNGLITYESTLGGHITIPDVSVADWGPN